MRLSHWSVKRSIRLHLVGIIFVHQNRVVLHVEIIVGRNIFVDIEVDLIAVSPAEVRIGQVLLVLPLNGSRATSLHTGFLEENNILIFFKSKTHT